MTAVILVAGVGSRLRPLTDAVPKCLLDVGGKPLLGRMLEGLLACGIRDVALVTGFRHDLVDAFSATFRGRLNLTTIINRQYGSTNNNYSLWRAGAVVRGKEFLLMDGDILFAPEVLTGLLTAPDENALILRRSGELGEEEVKIEADSSGVVLHIGKDVSPQRAAGESLGIEKFTARGSVELFAVLDRRKDRYEFYEASFQEMIDAGAVIRAIDIGTQPCIEIDTLEDLETARRLAADHAI